ncbi:bifunctional metallophosphatase/5'-nucleotidase [Eubacterium sp.]|uniref:bifunctional metallophosphatase/5'-nucleotidase n=1 Tax=Eubacterium sp. TaxID=142586 RepID=UPI002FC6D402
MEAHIIIYFTTDLHGVFRGNGSHAIGMAHIGGLKNDHPRALLVDAGDATQGGLLSRLSAGKDMIAMMNAAHYDVAAVGNHDFDYGYGYLVENARYAHFPLLSANGQRYGRGILEGETYHHGQCINNGRTAVFTRCGKRIGFFSVGTPDLFPQSSQGYPGEQGGITIMPPIPAARECVAALKAQGADFIIALAHLGNDASVGLSDSSNGLAEAMAGLGLDVIIDGHSHANESGRWVGDTLIVQSGSYASRVGRLTINPITRELTSILLRPQEIRGMVDPDENVLRVRAALENRYKDVMDNQTLKLPHTLWGGTVEGVNVGRLTETSLGDAVADAMALAAQKRFGDQGLPIIAMQNGGGIRTRLCRGNITRENSIRVLPFDNKLYFARITPAVLYKAMENGVSRILGQDPYTGRLQGAAGRFPQISGFTLDYDPDAPGGQRVRAITLEGEETPLDPQDRTRVIVIALDEAKIIGGDDYTMLMDLEDLGETSELEPALWHYLKHYSKSARDWRPRIRTVGQYQPSPYDATLSVMWGGKPYSGEMTYRVDDGPIKTVRSEAGKCKLPSLSPGAHTITLMGMDILVDNYAGLGSVENPVPVVVLDANLEESTARCYND